MGQPRRSTTNTSRLSIEAASVSQLQAADTPAFDQLLALYREAFPPEERKPTDTLRHMLGRPDYRFWIAQRNAQVIAFAIVHTSSTHHIALLEYLAVHHSLRSLGLGRHLLQHIVAVLLEAHRSVLIEIETDKPPSPHRAQRHRLKQFYRSFGAREVADLCYQMPQVAAGTPPPMDLLVLRAEPARTLTRSTLHAWLTSLYVEVYGQSSADPRLTSMLARLPEEIVLL